ncbi:hypothetical protein CCACVL1_24665 [Corchorus capsularis]|uniref:Uncharacterized protein n=1 Tax=Corchorus capsularis TaxID=210143 RepID=A0A1R3GNJ1_COCAP|nr:hypothetical protein CCACVL1_24665 [Corchorus capsularis]
MAQLESLDESKKKKPKRNHGSTELFVLVDYIFFIVFFGFLVYILVRLFNVF